MHSGHDTLQNPGILELPPLFRQNFLACSRQQVSELGKALRLQA
jgi:hypothetical protein